MKPERICAACTMVVATRNHTPVGKIDVEMKRLARKYQGRFLRLDTLNMTSPRIFSGVGYRRAGVSVITAATL